MIRLESCDRSLYLISELPTLFDMLKRILSPGIAVTLCNQHPMDARTITVGSDPQLKGWTACGDMPAYVIDKGKIEFSLEDIQQNSAVFIKHADEGADPVRLSASDDKHWRVDIASAEIGNLRGVTRLVRYVFGCFLFRSGVRFLHAASVAVDGRAYVFAGDSGSGKSSLMFKCCAELGGEFISDDLIGLWGSPDGKVMVSGWPKRVAVGTNLIEPGSLLERRMIQSRAVESRHYQDDAPTSSWSASGRSRLRFDSAQFLNAFGFCGVRSAPLGAVLLPHADSSMLGWHARRLPAFASRQSLRNSDSAQIRYVTDALGLFKGAKLELMNLPDGIDVPAVEAHYGPQINSRFIEFWNDVNTRIAST
ncbi:hypothetical protein [Pseudomonas sp. B16120]|uniref:hypothetical protein n=1 Tax=Pseudomonas sp. B16120 TaxID=3235108 RepID=UPI00378514CB